MTFCFHLDLFCRVIDNYGDAGVCLRLARQLAQEYSVFVRLIIDKIDVLYKIAPSLKKNNSFSSIPLEVKTYDEVISEGNKILVADVIVEGFGCGLPDNYRSALSRSKKFPVWINMEYLSAEAWVEECHQLASVYSGGVRKYFFFPGFSDKTGGIICEKQLISQKNHFQNTIQSRKQFLNDLNINTENKFVISLFCYKNAPVLSLFDVLSRQNCKDILCLIPEGVVDNEVTQFYETLKLKNTTGEKNRLELQKIPFLAQEDYDKLLWICDFNFVRGEDSFVRAQLAEKPFIWQIYPQDENAHYDKLNAFLERYLQFFSETEAKIIRKAWEAWNGMQNSTNTTVNLEAMLVGSNFHGNDGISKWVQNLMKNTDFASSLYRFIVKLR